MRQLAERTGGREKAVQVPGSSAWSHPPASCDARFHLPLFPSLPASAPRWLLGHELPIGDTCYMPASTTNSNTGRVASCRIASHRISSRRIASHRSVPSPVFHLAPPSVAVSARHRSVCLGGGPGADERQPDLLQPAKRDATISGTRIRIGRPRAHARGTCRHTAAEAETQPCGLVARLPSPDAIGQAPPQASYALMPARLPGTPSLIDRLGTEVGRTVSAARRVEESGPSHPLTTVALAGVVSRGEGTMTWDRHRRRCKAKQSEARKASYMAVVTMTPSGTATGLDTSRAGCQGLTTRAEQDCVCPARAARSRMSKPAANGRDATAVGNHGSCGTT
ncbi:hypothetical protein ACCO45_004003 [Purpureocillium lilacinum]|uniref:Uncharacterized protein n=1 Tax=Purpureocillium lilacinum TaxID=33203 RepID=A0ACC4E4A3_PURLI